QGEREPWRGCEVLGPALRHTPSSCAATSRGDLLGDQPALLKPKQPAPHTDDEWNGLGSTSRRQEFTGPVPFVHLRGRSVPFVRGGVEHGRSPRGATRASMKSGRAAPVRVGDTGPPPRRFWHRRSSSFIVTSPSRLAGDSYWSECLRADVDIPCQLRIAHRFDADAVLMKAVSWLLTKSGFSSGIQWPELGTR